MTRLRQIHEATTDGPTTARDLVDASLDCILAANDAEHQGHHVMDVALAQAAVYAQLAQAAAVLEAASIQAKAVYDGRA